MRTERAVFQTISAGTKLYFFQTPSYFTLINMTSAPRRYAWIALLLLGLASGILSDASPTTWLPIRVLWVGGVFGTMLSVYFCVFRGFRNFLNVGLFVFASSIAYFIAFFGSLAVVAVRPSGPELAPVACEGFIGGLLTVYLTFYLLRSPGLTFPKHKLLLGGLVSGLLGAAGWKLGPLLGKIGCKLFPCYRNLGPDSYHFWSLYVIWQIGMMLFIGLVADLQEKEHTMRRAALLED
jgi:hypothetical protein